jgi:hypothetical protein
MSSDLPARSSGPPTPAGAPRLSTEQLEAVIRRAVELQGPGDAAADDGVSEAEILRIGQELGLSPQHVRQAIREVRGVPVREHGMLASAVGPATVRASRTIRRPATDAGLFIEQYLLEMEAMVVERRFPDRTRYVRSTGIAAGLSRALNRMGAKHAGLKTEQLDVGVAAVDAETCLVELQVDLAGARYVAAGVGGGVGLTTAGTAATFAMVAGVEWVALAGIPLMAVSWWTARASFAAVYRSRQNELEAFLDRLEHGELKVKNNAAEWRRKLGF